MKITLEQVKASVEKLPPGRAFEYAYMPGYGQRPFEVARMVNQLAKDGVIIRYMPSVFYRPQQGVLGIRPLTVQERLRYLLYRNGRRVAYVTGHALYNSLGLSTQIPVTVTLATQGKLQSLDLGTIKIEMVKSRVDFQEADIPALEVLDALAGINDIQDTTPEATLSRLKKYVQTLPEEAKQSLFKNAQAYPASAYELLNKII